MHQDTPLFVNKFCKQPCAVSPASACVAVIQAAVKQTVTRQGLMAGASVSNSSSIRKSPDTAPVISVRSAKSWLWV